MIRFLDTLAIFFVGIVVIGCLCVPAYLVLTNDVGIFLKICGTVFSAGALSGGYLSIREYGGSD